MVGGRIMNNIEAWKLKSSNVELLEALLEMVKVWEENHDPIDRRCLEYTKARAAIERAAS